MPHQCLKCGELFNEGSTIILRGCPECRGTRFFYTQTPLTMSEREKLLAASEVTLRDAIDRLVQQAKDGEKITDEDGARWSISGPQPTKVVADPALVPNDLPITKLSLSVDIDEKKLVVKIPQAPRLLRRKKKETIRWDYTEPEPIASRSQSPPLFSDVGLRAPTRSPAAPAPTPPVVASPLPTPAPGTAPTVEVVPVAPPKPAAPASNPTLDSFLPPAPAPKPETVRGLAPLAERAADYAPDPEIQPSGEAPETIRISKPGEYEIDVKRLMESNPIVIQRDGTYLIHLASLFEANRPKAD